MKYQSKPTVIEATQWFPNLNVEGVKINDGGGAYLVTTHGNIVDLLPGDWVVTEPDGNGYYPVKPHIFATKYEPLSKNQ